MPVLLQGSATDPQQCRYVPVGEIPLAVEWWAAIPQKR
ncbi:hypothetical protein HMPREF9303_2028 [Prevotella denticola CRIS 18C-A]|uniref:Uncharacterized protein n=1 Tax=Prevotella denticola CRIS 18C-A TaxID=944557 RepID=F0H4S9_9BACT|nr:hypothetical protein HMPREF9303_2028 [Prevotella denticola CRIS 18C-A]